MEAAFAEALRGLCRAEAAAQAFDGLKAAKTGLKAGVFTDAVTVIGELEAAIAALPAALEAVMDAAASAPVGDTITRVLDRKAAKAAAHKAEAVKSDKRQS